MRNEVRIAAACGLAFLVGSALAQSVRVPPALYAEFERNQESNEPVRALVALQPPLFEIQRPQIFSDTQALARYIESSAQAFAAAKQTVLAALPGVTIERDYPHLPIVLVRMQAVQSLNALAERRGIRAINPIVRHSASLKESLPLAGKLGTAAQAASGEGVSVVVADTGVDHTAKGLGECDSVGEHCPVIYSADVAPDDGMFDDNGKHGTNVAAIILAMAPKAKIISLDVFRQNYATSDDIIAAVNWAVANKTRYNIVAINLSLGSDPYMEPCVGSVYLDAFRRANSAGIVPVVASGNDHWRNALQEPACAPFAVSVGAVYDSSNAQTKWPSAGCEDPSASADHVACFSNAAHFLMLLAPGAMVDAGGVRKAGTSQAAPFVSGAVAALASAFRGAKPEALIDAMLRTGKVVVDSRTSMPFPRLDLDAALEFARQHGFPN